MYILVSYAKSMPTPENWFQVSNQLSSVGSDLVLNLELNLADAKSVPTSEILCRFGTNLVLV